jgi:hypothetical protein
MPWLMRMWQRKKVYKVPSCVLALSERGRLASKEEIDHLVEDHSGHMPRTSSPTVDAAKLIPTFFAHDGH